MANNIRNSRTTHPRKSARRERASERFSILKVIASKDNAYRVRKLVEAKSLGIESPVFI